jgi:putative phosphoribosyl transferase
MINFPDLDGADPPSESNETLNQVTPFPDLSSAGRELASKLAPYREGDNVVVLAIVLGGVPVAREVANFLRAPLDLVIIRRLLAPQGPGSQICAVNIGGSMVIDKELIPRPAVPSTPLDHFTNDAIVELSRREQNCRRGRPPTDLSGKAVILVDCGIRSGSTMVAAISALRTRAPARIVAAVPVASLGGHAAIASLADEIVCLARPRPFGHVGLWYKDFTRPGDDRVSEVLETEAYPEPTRLWQT